LVFEIPNKCLKGILVGMSFTEMFAANDWKPFQSCFHSNSRLVIVIAIIEYFCMRVQSNVDDNFNKVLEN
jgi:hypothetical protein